MRLATVMFVAFALLGACVSVEYDGASYPPTSSVAVYRFSEQITTPYEILGRATATADRGTSIQELERELEKEARARGADAMLLHSLDSLAGGDISQYDVDFGKASGDQRTVEATFLRFIDSEAQ